MPLDSTALDAALEDGIRNMSKLRAACSHRELQAANDLVARLADVRNRPEPEQRVLSAVHLAKFSTSWHGYDDASSALHAMIDAHNAAVPPIVHAANAALVGPEGVAFLVAHAGDKEVERVLSTVLPQLSAASRHRILLARPGRSEQRIGETHLLFLAHGQLVVVDGRHCYGPARPPIVAAVGRMSSPTRPGPRFIQLRDFGDRPLAVDLELLQATDFQRPKVVRHNPVLRTLDDHGVVLGVGRTEHRYTWDELAWSPLKPFEG